MKIIFKGLKRIQILWKCRFYKRKFQDIRKKTRKIQRLFKRRLLKKNIITLLKKVKQMKHSVTVISAFYKKTKCKHIYLHQKKCAQTINRLLRGHIGRKKGVYRKFIKMIAV